MIFGFKSLIFPRYSSYNVSNTGRVGIVVTEKWKGNILPFHFNNEKIYMDDVKECLLQLLPFEVFEGDIEQESTSQAAGWTAILGEV